MSCFSQSGDGITFRLNEDGEVLEDANADVEEAAEDNAWRVQRFEREELLASRVTDAKHEDEEEHEALPNAENSFSVLCKKIQNSKHKFFSCFFLF